MKTFELCTRNAISRTITKLLKKKKITQKQIISILNTTRERYVLYALKGFPLEKLEIVLQILEIDIFEFMNQVDLDVREYHKNEVPPNSIQPQYTGQPIQEALYQVIKEYWLEMNPNTIALLDAWIEEYSVYYLYLFIIKQSYTTQNDLEVINQYQISMHDYMIFIYYELTYMDIEIMYEQLPSDVYMYLMIKQLTTFYKRHAKQNDHSSLRVLIELAEKALL